MPVLPVPTYRMRGLLGNGHVQTILPALCRPMPQVVYQRERLETSDGDFLDVDFAYAMNCSARCRSSKVAVVSHGLEGHSHRRYVRGMARVLNEQGWDVAAWNFRGCSGTPNRMARMYHSGDTQDLQTVVSRCDSYGYETIALIGVSMGGNQILKYLGEAPELVPSAVVAACVFSVPCDLTGAAVELAKPENAVYMRYFMRSLKEKVRAKHARYPDLIPVDGLDSMRSFAEFDNTYTAPLHGFSDAQDYWTRSSCKPFLSGISVPVLLVNALNDPFLSASCYPYKEAWQNKFLHLETPHTGGHVGFIQLNKNNVYWSEERVIRFFDMLGV
ncbi:YheT family hydrolase [Oleidesulfovibrio sp.]|uniref:YheT family hydrolase n=1 Tax=Oleidesulfovibrio sp. TaxID=2909707 RepID=UPI003A874E98